MKLSVKKIEAILHLFEERVVTIIQPDGQYVARLVKGWKIRHGSDVLDLRTEDIVALTVKPDDKLTIQTKVNLPVLTRGQFA